MDRIRAKDELSVSLHMPETKHYEEQSTKKPKKALVKAKVPLSKTKKPGPGLL
jgi:hypothetical protein